MSSIINSIYALKKEISSLFSHFNFSGEARLVEDYQENSLWY